MMVGFSIDVEQTKKIAPFITREALLSRHDCVLFFRVNTFDLDLESKLILPKNKSNATLWVVDTCVIVGC